jgi:hypothetical protein
MSKKYNYTILNYPKEGDKYGKYSGKTPGIVANKIFNKLMKYYNFIDNMDGKKYLVFEFENMDTGKIYEYIGTPIKLQNPMTVNIHNKNISVDHRSIVVKYDNIMKEIFTSELKSIK